MRYGIFILITSCFYIASCDNDVLKKLSGDYVYYYEGGDMSMILHEKYVTKKSIYGKVIDFDYNDEYIVVIQKPIYEQYINELAADIFETLPDGNKRLYKDDTTRRGMADSILKNDEFYQRIF